MFVSEDHRHQARRGCGFTGGAVLSQQSNHRPKILGVVTVGNKSGFLAGKKQKGTRFEHVVRKPLFAQRRPRCTGEREIGGTLSRYTPAAGDRFGN